MQIFTAREIRLIAFVMAAALIGTAVKAWRANRDVSEAVAAASR